MFWSSIFHEDDYLHFVKELECLQNESSSEYQTEFLIYDAVDFEISDDITDVECNVLRLHFKKLDHESFQLTVDSYEGFNTNEICEAFPTSVYIFSKAELKINIDHLHEIYSEIT
jgi:hypothetical protein